MALKRIHVAIPPPMLKNLDKLAERYAMDRSSAIRYCLARTLEEEGITKDRNVDGIKGINRR
jgi:metal-responsive CopG/Arc/MetJ family transcriptional regulator